jgi:hypothetical protein
MMDAEELRAAQTPLKERYRKAPDAALIALRAQGRRGSARGLLRSMCLGIAMALGIGVLAPTALAQPMIVCVGPHQFRTFQFLLGSRTPFRTIDEIADESGPTFYGTVNDISRWILWGGPLEGTVRFDRAAQFDELERLLGFGRRVTNEIRTRHLRLLWVGPHVRLAPFRRPLDDRVYRRGNQWRPYGQGLPDVEYVQELMGYVGAPNLPIDHMVYTVMLYVGARDLYRMVLAEPFDLGDPMFPGADVVPPDELPWNVLARELRTPSVLVRPVHPGDAPTAADFRRPAGTHSGPVPAAVRWHDAYASRSHDLDAKTVQVGPAIPLGFIPTRGARSPQQPDKGAGGGCP